MTRVVELQALVEAILALRRSVPPERSALVALTGIDGCGKGFVAAKITEAIEALGSRVALINLDGWLNLPHVRFNADRPAEHFYLHAIRFEAMFEQLVIPLRERRSLRVETDHVEETATEYRRHVYTFRDIDVILLEGIYLLKQDLQDHYDLSCWVDCSFETALERAIARAQEGLSPEDTRRAYRTIYFPAQQLHFERDDPRQAATFTLNNDPRLGTGG